MINSILAAAVCGGVGGALGAAFGAGFDKLRGKPSRAVAIMGLVLGIAGARLAPIIFPTPSLTTQLDGAGPAYKVIHRYYPATFAQMVKDIETSDASDKIAFQNKVRPGLSKLVADHRAQMDDVVAAQLTQLLLDETLILQDKSPESCVGLLTGGATTIDMSSVFPEELQKRDAVVTAQLLEQVATRPAPAVAKLSDEEAAGLVVAAFNQLAHAEQTVVRPLIEQAKVPSTPAEARAFCAFNRNLFSVAMNGSKGTLRRLLSS